MLAVAVCAAAPAALASGGEPADGEASPPLLCETAIKAAERIRQLPLHLLQAIAFTESGKMSAAHGHRIAWPWTVMAEGEGRYYPSKQAAIDAVRALQARGVGNIDVGCMQVNLHYHGKAFASLEEAFDPVHNVAYATEFLLKLRRDSNSWTRAIKQYHSRERARQLAYRARVYEEWQALKHGRTIVAEQARPAADGPRTTADTAAGRHWPPRSYAEQKRLQSALRARLLSAQP